MIFLYILPFQILTYIKMKLLKKATYAIVFFVTFAFTFQCASPKVASTATFEEQAPFKVKPVYFQEWYAGIKVGGTGMNIFLPISEVSENVEIERVYFRNLTGELTQKVRCIITE